MSREKALVLLSGGLDSATALAIAREQDYQCYALSFRYGQRHSAELAAAQKIATDLAVVEHRIFDLDLSLFSNSALTNHELTVPTVLAEGIPVTYVPARNVIFLSIALGWAEVLHAQHIFIGVNAVDYSGYPDCRPAFVQSYELMANLATKSAVEGASIKIHTPLIDLTKAEIISRGLQLGVNYENTVSCYQASSEGEACGECDSCRLRAEGFMQSNVQDPTKYKQK